MKINQHADKQLFLYNTQLLSLFLHCLICSILTKRTYVILTLRIQCRVFMAQSTSLLNLSPVCILCLYFI